MKTPYTINTVTAIAMVLMALVFDLVQFLLDLTVLASIVSMFIGALAFIIFWVWFMLLGIKYSGKGAAMKMLTALASVVVELIPIIDALPGISLGVVALIVQSRIDDKAKAIAHAKEEKIAAQKALEQQRRQATLYARQMRTVQAANDNQQQDEGAVVA